MSSTSHYTNLSKSTIEKYLVLRGSQSAVKKKPVFPKKITPLAPLDFNAIKREILEASSNESQTFNDYPRSPEIPEAKGSSVNIDNCLGSIKEDNNDKLIDESTELNKENVEQKKNTSVKANDNDSFDLDFSVLSLHTPIKKEHTVPVTPKETRTEIFMKKPMFDSFVTPKIKNTYPSKVHCSVPRNTPVNVANKNSIIKAESSHNSTKNIVFSIPRSIPDDKTFDRLEVNNMEYLILNLLGKGGSSVVYQCFCMDRRILVAIKCVSLENSISAQGYINEVKLLQRLQYCDRIIKLYDYEILEAEKKLFVVLEKGGEDFSTVLKNLASQKSNISVYMLLFYWMEMLQAVKEIHSNEIIHSDLKPSNFLWGEKGLKLIDFGIASSVQTDMTSVIKSIPEGSCNYMSPEALSSDTSSPGKCKYKLHYKSDVWSLGCILYQLVYKRPPFFHLNNLWTKLAFIMDTNHQIEYPDVNWVPTKIIQTIKKCLRHDVKLRPSVNELIQEYDSVLCNI